MTLDQAEERFTSNPNSRTAKAYRAIAQSYHNDEMIGYDSLAYVIRRTAPFLR